ncbi:5-carboxymethyl-2-hydroxymuconic-semialdehyde dehydrogenase [Novosphingobium kunmingense]|uniref:5-carboxymethyl-2-hydroxymuconic-semialdehyde dehydrogenase n=1 Tax=Novosphingobium kunmingense TaxID=1211806 RepID=A0A2N0H6N9_9SPHN|nr:aldehyde dehydrogenase [Novosphingobium kunmingense]PKB14598.1 5-carboxymethyl-2-hydroxymuconic-semialdehyde dehydrogenase [Novosphingobium kunmingense]
MLPVSNSLINGKPYIDDAATLVEIIDPSTEEVASHLAEANAKTVDLAAKAARQAFKAWSTMGTDNRNDILYAIHDRLVVEAQSLAQIEARTTGLPVRNLAALIRRTAANFRSFAEFASSLSGESYLQNPDFLTYVTREPKGVAALISPWNAPLALSSMRIATCIAFGNTCVLKPSEYTPQSVLRMVELMHEAGLPEGVVNVVNGRGTVTGSALVDHPEVDMVGFTGGTMTGRAIMAAAGRRLKPSIMELGGKSAAIVCADADFDRAIDGTLAGIYANNGQQCLGGSRILVERRVADHFISEFVRRTRAIKLGDPLDPSTEMGPLAYRAHRDRVLSYLDAATNEGAEVLCGGGRPQGLERGWYVEPIAVLAKDNASRVCQEEIFGPFATFLIFDSLDEAISIANASDFGLVAYVWTASLDAAMRCSREIRAGTIWINTPMMRELRAPFGGYKDSGTGRDGASSSADFFTELKTTSIPLREVPLPVFGAAARD